MNVNYVVFEEAPLSEDYKVPFETLEEANDYAIETWLNIAEEDRAGRRLVVRSFPVPEGEDWATCDVPKRREVRREFDTHFDSDLHVHTLDLTPQDVEEIAVSLYENDFRHWQDDELIRYFISTGIWRTLDFYPMGRTEFMYDLKRVMKSVWKNEMKEIREDLVDDPDEYMHQLRVFSEIYEEQKILFEGSFSMLKAYMYDNWSNMSRPVLDHDPDSAPDVYRAFEEIMRTEGIRDMNDYLVYLDYDYNEFDVFIYRRGK